MAIETKVAMYLRQFGASTGQMHSAHPHARGDSMRRLQLAYGDGKPDSLTHELVLEAVMEDGQPAIKATFRDY